MWLETPWGNFGAKEGGQNDAGALPPGTKPGMSLDDPEPEKEPG